MKKYFYNKSYIKATLESNKEGGVPLVVLNTKNAFETMSLLCALCGEAVIVHSDGDKEFARKMKFDVLNTMSLMFDEIINNME